MLQFCCVAPHRCCTAPHSKTATCIVFEFVENQNDFTIRVGENWGQDKTSTTQTYTYVKINLVWKSDVKPKKVDANNIIMFP
jgi:hypothetical protein